MNWVWNHSEISREPLHILEQEVGTLKNYFLLSHKQDVSSRTLGGRDGGKVIREEYCDLKVYFGLR